MARAKNLLKNPPPDDSGDDDVTRNWKHKAELLASYIDFRKRCDLAIDAILNESVSRGCDCMSSTFKTRGDRPVLILMACGEDAVSKVKQAIKDHTSNV